MEHETHPKVEQGLPFELGRQGPRLRELRTKITGGPPQPGILDTPLSPSPSVKGTTPTCFIGLLPGLNELSHVQVYANCEVSRCFLCEGQRAAGPGLMLLPPTSHLQSDPHSLLSTLLPVNILLKRTGRCKCVQLHIGLSPWKCVLRLLGAWCHQPCTKLDRPAGLVGEEMNDNRLDSPDLLGGTEAGQRRGLAVLPWRIGLNGPRGRTQRSPAVLSLASVRSMWSPPLPAWGHQAKTEKWRNRDVCFQGRGGGGSLLRAEGLSSFSPHYHLLNGEDMYSEVGGPASRLTPTLGAQPPPLTVPSPTRET